MPVNAGSAVLRVKAAIGPGGRYFGKLPLFLLGALLFAFLIISSFGGVAAGQISGSGTISGTVTNEAGAPLEGIHVSTYQQGGYAYAYAFTDAAGNYTLSGLVSGDSQVEFYDYNNVYFAEFYDNQPDWASADAIAVTAPSAVTGKDAVLSTCTATKPALSISVEKVYWASYEDYHDLRKLSIDYSISNSGATAPSTH